MKLVFSKQRILEGKMYPVGEYEADDVTAARLLERFPKVVRKWRKPRTRRKAKATTTVKVNESEPTTNST